MLTKKDYDAGREVRWCPGCGDYAVLATVQKFLASIQADPSKTVFVSGIGCSSRFPYYMNTYGFHTLHGRAPTVATGVKLANPELDVWVITGDGDGLSIGAHHLMHLMRRNVGVKVLMLNNRIYGLTKGQYSPTSEEGKITKTSPKGSLDNPVTPLSFALSSGCSFVANAIDVDAKGLHSVISAAHEHEGTAFIEIYQNCNVFNDGAFESFANKGVRAERTVNLVPGEPLTFGAEGQKVLVKEGEQFVVKPVVQVDPKAAYKHDVTQQDITQALQLSHLDPEKFPIPLGVYRAVPQTTYEARALLQGSSQPGERSLSEALCAHANVWSVE